MYACIFIFAKINIDLLKKISKNPDSRIKECKYV